MYFGEIHDYKVELSYQNEDGSRCHFVEYTSTYTASNAARYLRDVYDDLPGIRIESVWIETPTCWDVCEFEY